MGYRRYGSYGYKINPKSFMYLFYIIAFFIVVKYLEYFIGIGTLLILLFALYKYYIHPNSDEDFSDTTLKEVDKMTGTQFEIYVSQLYEKQGYKTLHTGGSGDFGADVIISKNNNKIIIQAKRQNYTVGTKAVQEAISGREYHKGTKAIVITNNRFTRNAKILAMSCDVTLLDRDSLITMIEKNKKKNVA